MPVAPAVCSSHERPRIPRNLFLGATATAVTPRSEPGTVGGRRTGVAFTDGLSVDRADRRGALVGYASSDKDQRDHANDELRWQAEAIATECEQRGLHLLAVVREHERQHHRTTRAAWAGVCARPDRGRKRKRSHRLRPLPPQSFPAGPRSGAGMAGTSQGPACGRRAWPRFERRTWASSAPDDHRGVQLGARAIGGADAQRYARRASQGAGERRGPSGAQRADRGYARRGYEPPSDRRPAERRRDSHGQRWRQVAPFERASSRRLPAPTHRPCAGWVDRRFPTGRPRWRSRYEPP